MRVHSLHSLHFPLDASTRVMTLCRRSGLPPGELATILSEISDDAVAQYRSQLLAETWPDIFTAYLAGGYGACGEPAVLPLLARAYVASYCHALGVRPSALREAARACAASWQEAPLTPSLQAAAMLHEMADHLG